MEDWIIGVLLALFLIVPCWLALSRRKDVQKQVEAWPELAERTGLSYGPGHLVRGEYRGRLLRQILEAEVMGPPWTLILLNVQNSAGFSLALQVMGIFNHGHQIAEISSGNLDFDNRFILTGSSREYAQAAVELIVQGHPRLLTWMMQNFCSIELKGENLLWSQNGELTDVNNQLELFNLLCDLAEQCENMGIDELKYAELRREESD